MLKNGLFNLSAGIIRAGLAFISIPILIKLMGIEEYGVWTLVSSIIGFLLIAEAGLSVSTTVFASQDLAKNDYRSLSQTLTIIIGAMLILATASTLLLWISSGAITEFFPKLTLSQKQVVKQALQMGSIAVWCQLVQQCFIGIEQAYQQYGILSILRTLYWLFLTLGWWFLAWRGGTAEMLARWQTLIAMLSLAAHLFFSYSLMRGKTVSFNFNPKRSWDIMRYSATSWISTIGGMLFLKGDRLVIGSLLGSSQLAIYSAMADISYVINFFSIQVIQPLIPKVSQLISEKKSHHTHEALENIIRKAIKLNTTVATIFGVTLIYFSSDLISRLLSEKSSETIYLFQALLIIYTIYSLNVTGYYTLLGIKKVKQCAFISLASGAITLGFISAGANYFGLLGAVLGNAGYLLTISFLIAACMSLKIPVKNLLSWTWLQLVSFFFIISIIISSIYFHIQLYILPIVAIYIFVSLRQVYQSLKSSQYA